MRTRDPEAPEEFHFLRPNTLAGVGVEGDLVEVMSYPFQPKGNVHWEVFARMVPGQPTSAKYVPCAGLVPLTFDRFYQFVERQALAVEDVARFKTKTGL